MGLHQVQHTDDTVDLSAHMTGGMRKCAAPLTKSGAAVAPNCALAAGTLSAPFTAVIDTSGSRDNKAATPGCCVRQKLARWGIKKSHVLVGPCRIGFAYTAANNDTKTMCALTFFIPKHKA